MVMVEGAAIQFTKKALEKAGFEGWISFDQLPSSSCPANGGIYVVTYSGGNPVSYPKESCGGWFKERNPSVIEDQLVANWVDDAEVVYIGKGKSLRKRLLPFARFGTGKPTSHWGGRLIWQLPRISDLRVAWKETPGRSPEEAEAELIAMFRSGYGKPPFANNPDRWGA